MTEFCCAGMAYHATLPPRAGHDRFSDPECLIHIAEDGRMGIIQHDGNRRYSIIRFCPWCGAGLTQEAAAERAPIYKVSTQDAASAVVPRSHHKKASQRTRRPLSQAERDAAAARMRAMHEKKRLARLAAVEAAALAPGQDDDQESME